jgi:hypothetical protein
MSFCVPILGDEAPLKVFSSRSTTCLAFSLSAFLETHNPFSISFPTDTVFSDVPSQRQIFNDTVEGFKYGPLLTATALNATTPDGYKHTFVNLNGSITVPSYMDLRALNQD